MGQRVNKILEEDNNVTIIGMGNFNMEAEVLDRKLKRTSKGIHHIEGVGSKLSRFPTNKVATPKNIDHFIGSQAVNFLCRKARVLRKYPISDHQPIMMQLRKSLKAPKALRETEKARINVDIYRQVGEKLVIYTQERNIPDCSSGGHTGIPNVPLEG
jgi:hypothetical protein